MSRGFRLGGDVELTALKAEMARKSERSLERAGDSDYRNQPGARFQSGAEVVDTDQRSGPPARPSPGTLRPAVSAAPFSPGAVNVRPTPHGVGAVPLERDVQAGILALLRVHPRVAFAYRQNTGAAERTNKDGTTRRIYFAFPGCSDILGMLKGGRFLAIECKRPGGRQPTREQVEFLGLVNRGGGLAFIARSVDDVVRMLDPKEAA